MIQGPDRGIKVGQDGLSDDFNLTDAVLISIIEQAIVKLQTGVGDFDESLRIH